MNELLDSIYQIGEKMRTTLAEDNLKGFYALLGERQKAIQQLTNASEKKAPSLEISEKFSQLEEQFSLIMNDLRMKEQTMMKDLHQVRNLKNAQHSYNFDRQPYRFLRNNISG